MRSNGSLKLERFGYAAASEGDGEEVAAGDDVALAVSAIERGRSLDPGAHASIARSAATPTTTPNARIRGGTATRSSQGAFIAVSPPSWVAGSSRRTSWRDRLSRTRSHRS